MSFRVLSLSAGLCAAMACTAAFAQAPAAAPADGITMDMMPITSAQITECRNQASSQLATEQDTLHKREHGQDNDKMKQGAVAGVLLFRGLASADRHRRRQGAGHQHHLHQPLSNAHQPTWTCPRHHRRQFRPSFDGSV